MAGYETVLRHIDRLRLYVQRLYELQHRTREEVLTDWRVQFQVDRGLQLAVEVVISVAEQLVAILDRPVPDSSSEAIRELVRASVLTPELGKEMVRAVGFRNIIVHGYMDIEYHIVYDVIQDDVVYFEQFIAQVAAFVEKQMASDER